MYDQKVSPQDTCLILPTQLPHNLYTTNSRERERKKNKKQNKLVCAHATSYTPACLSSYFVFEPQKTAWKLIIVSLSTYIIYIN